MTETPPETLPDGGLAFPERQNDDSNGDDRPPFDLDLPEDSLFTEEDYYKMYRIAADPLRSKIMRALSVHERLSTGQISKLVDRDANDLHYHLRQLKQTALIRNQREPRSGTTEPYSYYTLTPLGETVLTEGLEDGVKKLAAQEREIREHFSK
ncbi:winged helix-turn-helix domain-containing protein [Natronobeatus ordinarius]|uniref:winged helix-turn-helix domain-containing protein n=1 Tax=Natronobeatus ordinarius TaxID=2963433 RepID=UPI0020CD78BC|nr:helix-turn-helix domain-containing protein [Natronobeatus ordinarius]